MARMLMHIVLALIYCGILGCATWVDRSGEAANHFEISECEQSCSVYDTKGPEQLTCLKKCMKKKGFVKAGGRHDDT